MPPSPLTPEQNAAIQRAINVSLRPINDRLDRGAEKMDEQGAALDAMRIELAKNTATTNEVRDLLAIGRNGLKVLGWLGNGIKWTGGCAAGLLGIWGLISAISYAITHGGQLPPKP